MATTPSVKVKQPTIEQIHRHLSLSLDMLLQLRTCSEIQDHPALSKLIEDIEFELRSLHQCVPAKQLELPF